MPRNKAIHTNPSGRRSTIHKERFKDAWETGIEITGASHPEERAEFERRKKALNKEKEGSSAPNEAVDPSCSDHEQDSIVSQSTQNVDRYVQIDLPDEIEIEQSTPRGTRNA